MNMRLLLRMVRLLRNPPSGSRLVMMLVVVGLSLAVAGIEYLGYWPEWAKSARMRP